MLLKFLFESIDELCKPSPKYTTDKVQMEVGHRRNKAVVYFHLIAIPFVLLQGILNPSAMPQTLFSVFIASIIVCSVFLSCHYHPFVFSLFYTFIMAIVGPCFTIFKSEGVHRAWIGVQMYPILVLMCTGSIRQFIFQAILHLIFLNTVYQPAMLKTVTFLSPENYMKSLTHASNALGILNIVIVGLIHLSIQNAYNMITVAEKKKEQVERQKNFLLGFSHELRNLINSVMGNVKLATMETLSEKAKDFLRNADLCGELLLHLINNILDTGKVEVGDLEINPSATNMHSTMERIWSICSELIRRKNLRGRLRIHRKLPEMLKIDHYRLTQIFLNLVGNAVKFTDNGLIDISIEWIPNTCHVEDKCFEPLPFNDDNEMCEGVFEKNQRVSILNNSYLILGSCHQRVNHVLTDLNRDCNRGILKVTVSDTGIGISKLDIDKLFHRFTQVGSDPSKRKLGTGLGLFITKELCERMGGKIKVFSKEEKGSSFIFCVPTDPVSNVQRTSVEEASPTDSLNRGLDASFKLKAMVVDDEPFSQSILKNFFNRLDIEVSVTAENGLDAFHKYTEQTAKGDRPQIVTMDLTMPIMDGKKAAQKIREFERERGLEPCLLIVVSGNCSESEIAECVDVNKNIKANTFLKKPARIDDLSKIVFENFKRTGSVNHLRRFATV